MFIIFSGVDVLLQFIEENVKDILTISCKEEILDIPVPMDICVRPKRRDNDWILPKNLTLKNQTNGLTKQDYMSRSLFRR